ncbi:hypothetical protein INT48_001164 [Thamnidium elegans]|uniref:Uncharacterized protein n=1 Tax=Thamnidium elegans TaxID=101142 RepID=A0A8H7SFJ5_9FUNG|nr:hypothetical protein INT48_001164 [Thamnidium elegans]
MLSDALRIRIHYLKKFVEQYSLTDRHYASSRYRTIVTKYLINDQKRLLLEYNTWKRSEDSTRFWTIIRRRKTQLDAHAGAVDYIDDIVNEEVGQLCKDKDHTRAVTDTAVNENENILLLRTETSQEASEKQAPTSSAFNGNEDCTDFSSVENEEAEAEPQATAIFNPYKDLSRFETAEDGNIYKLFDIYQAEATKLSNVGLMKIETHLHEILSFTNIIILFNHMTNNKKVTSTTNDKFEKIIVKMSRVIQAVEDNKMTRSDAELELLNFARRQTYYLSRMIRDINNAYLRILLRMQLPFQKTSYLTRTLILFSSIISDPEKNTLLRWSNKKPEENKDMRPDATITKIQQLKYGYNLGHGEVKTKSSTCDNHALAHDLFRVSVLAKDTLDHNKLAHALAFQIHGFTITFYMMTLQFTRIYTLFEIARMNFPRSLFEISTFLSLKNIKTLAFVCEIFWSSSSPDSAPEVVKSRYHPTLETLYELVDGSKNRHRECSLHFEP